MAKRGDTEKVSCNFVFDGTLQSRVKGSLVIEVIKYLLYERQQIPMPFDHVKQELKRHSEQVQGNRNEQKKSKNQQLNKLEFKRATHAVKNLEELSSHVIQVFEMCPETQQALLIFGGTVVSPKESYLINLPGLNPDAEGMPLKTCVKSLYRQLISQDILGNSKTIGTTNLMVLLNAPREGGVDWFLPKPMFKPPTRGKQYVFNICGKQTCSSYGHNLTTDGSEYDIEISGIEPLECSGLNMSLEENEFNTENNLLQNDSYSSGRTLFHENDSSADTIPMQCDVDNSFNMTVDQTVFTLTDQEYMWFQAPLMVKGYRDKTSRQASMTDGFA